jgi:DNA-binding NarL/FixJ family response regulator
VVALVGQGDTNPQIAETLHVSVSTVKTHLVHAYQKLGIDTRAGLAAAAVTRKLVVEG